VNLLKDASLPEVVQVAGGRSLAFHPRMPLKSEVIEGLGAMMPTTKSPASVASALHRLDPKTAHALIQPRIDQEKAASTPDQKLISELEKFTAKK
jgi:hypothetical protein